METLAQDRGPRGCYHQVSPSATIAHLRSRETWVPCFPLEALEGEKSWVGVPAPTSRLKQVTPTPVSAGDPDLQCRAGGVPTHPLGLSVPGNTQWDSPSSRDTRSWLQGHARHRAPGRGDKESCHSPEDPSSLVARGGRGHPGEKETWVGGVLGGLQGVFPPCQHLGEPWSLTRSPGLPSLPSSPSKPAGPYRDKVRMSEGGLHRGALGVPEGPALGTPQHGNRSLGTGSSQQRSRGAQ